MTKQLKEDIQLAVEMWEYIIDCLKTVPDNLSDFSKVILKFKKEFAYEHCIKWKYHCLLCEIFVSSLGCGNCPLLKYGDKCGSIVYPNNSVYYKAIYSKNKDDCIDACKIIIKAIKEIYKCEI